MTRLEDAMAEALRDLIETKSRSVPYNMIQRAAWRRAATALEYYDQAKSDEALEPEVEDEDDLSA